MPQKINIYADSEIFCVATFDINLVQLGNSCGCRKITYLKK